MVIGTIEDFYGSFISGVWIYPRMDFSSPLDIMISRIGWGLFLLLTVEALIVFRTVINRKYHKVLALRKHVRIHWRLIGIISILFLALPVINHVFFQVYINYFLIFGLLGIWFLCDFILHIKHKKTIIDDILEMNPYFLGIMVVSAVLAVLIEARNISDMSWAYPTYLFCSDVFCKVLLVFAGWVLWLVTLISFYRVFKEELGKNI